MLWKSCNYCSVCGADTWGQAQTSPARQILLSFFTPLQLMLPPEEKTLHMAGRLQPNTSVCTWVNLSVWNKAHVCYNSIDQAPRCCCCPLSPAAVKVKTWFPQNLYSLFIYKLRWRKLLETQFNKVFLIVKITRKTSSCIKCCTVNPMEIHINSLLSKKKRLQTHVHAYNSGILNDR